MMVKKRKILRKTKDKLKQVEKALSQIDSNSSGKCKKCSKTISSERQLKEPQTELCAQCS